MKKTEAAPTLRAACLYRLGRYRNVVRLFPAAAFENADTFGAWNKTLSLFADWKNSSAKPEKSAARLNLRRQEIPAFLFEADEGSSPLPLEILRWVHSEALSLEGLLGAAELAALSGLRDEADALAKRLAESRGELERKERAKYAALTDAEITDLLVNRKWCGALAAEIDRLYRAASQGIAARVAELAGRYERTLPELEKDAAALERKVRTHLERMGFSW
ncbi:MAG: hypothetical protein FWG05_02145 [Kiritimatiellaeota bacterium]|nr:hypothetical protein [Kiritimatiellota bacterium]